MYGFVSILAFIVLNIQTAYAANWTGSSTPINQKYSTRILNYQYPVSAPFGSKATVKYDFHKEVDYESIGFGADYFIDSWKSQIMASYERNPLEPDNPATNLSVIVQTPEIKFQKWKISASEEVLFPLDQQKSENRPHVLTSHLHSHVQLNPFSKLFFDGSYSVMKTTKAPYIATLRNPYSASTGVSYTNPMKTTLKASFTQSADQDLNNAENKTLKFSLSRKILPRTQAKISAVKDLSSEHPEENKALLKVDYSF